MTDWEAMRARHSVRAYLDKPIPAELRQEMDAFAETCNRESGLHITVQYDDPAGFDSRLAHYGSFRNVANYIVLAGKKEGDFDFRCGYCGEKLVLLAQTLGLNTCWTALTFNKKRVRELVPKGESLCMAIALGYGENQGTQHRSKDAARVSELAGPAPDWWTLASPRCISSSVPEEKWRSNKRRENMAYKVLVICGSPHVSGCTNRALEEVCRTLNEEGVETEWVRVGKDDAHGCLGCGFCGKNDRCVFDDGVNEAAKLLREADGLLVGSPVHYGSHEGGRCGGLLPQRRQHRQLRRAEQVFHHLRHAGGLQQLLEPGPRLLCRGRGEGSGGPADHAQPGPQHGLPHQGHRRGEGEKRIATGGTELLYQFPRRKVKTPEIDSKTGKKKPSFW